MHPDGDCMVYQTEYRAFQAGFHAREMREQGGGELVDTQERSTAAVRLAAERAHDRAGLAYRRGDYHEAVACLRQAYEIDHSAPGLREHLALVRTAERAAVAKLSKARDLGEVADSFGERTQAWLAQRDANRGEPTEPCEHRKATRHAASLATCTRKAAL